ncbi:MAG: hypothetical protein HY955_07855 [Deltaproteobacteria bacterium]|nr:hypothetical protein [Deltaproteobacteria bacterium]
MKAEKTGDNKMDWLEYKTMRQYQSMGDLLGEMKVYGFGGGVESMIERKALWATENGYGWLTEDHQEN